MIESSAYFESYRHVLKQLQAMDTWPLLPMQNYLVHGRSENINQPQYITDMLREKKQEVDLMIEGMNLDPTQRKSLDHFLNNDLTLIQGPPGTGKTYIGVKIVSLLIKYA